MPKQRIAIGQPDVLEVDGLAHRLLIFGEWLDWHGLANNQYANVENPDNIPEGILWVTVKSPSNVRQTMKTIRKGLGKHRLIHDVDVVVSTCD
ncbi:MAG: hypothetical protein AAGF84_04410 [Planctomycetota bacterium]